MGEAYTEPGIVFNAGTKVTLAGWYVCVPCGYRRRFRKGERFPKCETCLKHEIEESYVKGLGLWERMLKNTTDV